jgi:hypothetical protein
MIINKGDAVCSGLMVVCGCYPILAQSKAPSRDLLGPA